MDVKPVGRPLVLQLSAYNLLDAYKLLGSWPRVADYFGVSLSTIMRRKRDFDIYKSTEQKF